MFQAYTQTNEDNLSSETQTEEIQTNIKWTQHPPRITKDMLTENVNLHQVKSRSIMGEACILEKRQWRCI